MEKEGSNMLVTITVILSVIQGYNPEGLVLF